MNVFLDKYNLVVGAITSILAVLFGRFWIFFAAFMVLNVIDYGTGWAKARFLGEESSAKGARGIVKKVGYWIVIGIAFFISVSCGELGQSMGMDLSFMSFIGYFTLATYIINEIRSIFENLILLGVRPPVFLIRGLAVMDKLIKEAADSKTGCEDKK